LIQNRGIDPEDLRQLEQELQQKRAESIRALMASPQQLTRTLQQWDARALQCQTKLVDAAKRLAQAQVDVGALGYWHWRIEYLALLTLIAVFAPLIFWFWPRSLPAQSYILRRSGKGGPRMFYPDPLRTPGATNPDVSQANIGRTLCNAAWSTRNIRPLESYTGKLKLQQMRDGGLPDSPDDYGCWGSMERKTGLRSPKLCRFHEPLASGNILQGVGRITKGSKLSPHH
jgi:hypothetical protein